MKSVQILVSKSKLLKGKCMKFRRLFGLLLAFGMVLSHETFAAGGDANEPQASTNAVASGEPVTTDRLLKGTDDTSGWLMYGGNYGNWRYSPLTDINKKNVDEIVPVWLFQTGVPGAQFANSPIVVDGVMYVSAAFNNLWALDAKTGTILWHYEHDGAQDVALCCGAGNRGVAIKDDLIYMATLDAKLIAFERATGEIRWSAELEDYKKGYSATSSPLIVGDIIISGIAGGEYGVRGFISAFDAATGKKLWKRYTVPAAGEPGSETWAGDSWKTGGGPTWSTGTYDPETNLVYWGVGNPAPDWNGDVRKGDNLYTNSLVALEPATGEMSWYFQFTPHDEWDYDATNPLIVDDVEVNGKSVRAVMQPNRNGYVYTLDAKTGEYLKGFQYTDRLTWSSGLDENGRPIVNEDARPKNEPGEKVCPGLAGGHNGAWTYAYNPHKKLMFVPTVESCMPVFKEDIVWVQSQPFWGGGPTTPEADDGSAYGFIAAIDPAGGEIKWKHKNEHPFAAGALATGGGIIFSGDQAGNAIALDDSTGELLWQFQTGSAVRSQPVTWKADGRQYVAIASGLGGLVPNITGRAQNVNRGGTLVVFALPETKWFWE